MVVFGLGFVMLTELVMRSITHNPDIIAPHSWWDMCGYVVAAIYCLVLHVFLYHRDRKLGVESPGGRHTLLTLPLWVWSIGYLVLGVVRVTSPK